MRKLFFLSVLFFCSQLSAAPVVGKVTVTTDNPGNKEASVYYRLPDKYNPMQQARVLIFFGGVNEDPDEKIIHGQRGWGPWADKHNIVIVAPYFIDADYWRPEAWSGKALQDGLAQIKAEYANINIDKMLFYGYSAGGRAANLFALWQDAWCRAWVSHACNEFADPSRDNKDIPGLVSFGLSDFSTLPQSRMFIEEMQALDGNLIWKGYIEGGHDVPSESEELARAFLLFHHEINLPDIGLRAARRMPGKAQMLVGDASSGKYYPGNARQIQSIAVENKVMLPTREIAEAWSRK